MRTDSPAAPQEPAPKKNYPSKRAKRYSTPSSLGWITINATALILATNRERVRQIVDAEQIRTRQLPGERCPKLWKDDVDRVAREAVRVGMPPQKNA